VTSVQATSRLARWQFLPVVSIRKPTPSSERLREACAYGWAKCSTCNRTLWGWPRHRDVYRAHAHRCPPRDATMPDPIRVIPPPVERHRQHRDFPRWAGSAPLSSRHVISLPERSISDPARWCDQGVPHRDHGPRRKQEIAGIVRLIVIQNRSAKTDLGDRPHGDSRIVGDAVPPPDRHHKSLASATAATARRERDRV
jgi:hypothetical protein